MTGGYPSKKNVDPNSPTHRWARSLLEDELAGLKTMKISLETFASIKEISGGLEGATFEDVIKDALEALKIQKDIGPQTLDSIVTNEE
jgi:hypothetical protein